MAGFAILAVGGRRDTVVIDVGHEVAAGIHGFTAGGDVELVDDRGIRSRAAFDPVLRSFGPSLPVIVWGPGLPMTFSTSLSIASFSLGAPSSGAPFS